MSPPDRALTSADEPVLLDRLAQQVSKQTARPTRTRFDTGDRSLAAILRKLMTRPYLILGSSHVIQIFALYMAGARVALCLPLTLQASTASTSVAYGAISLT